MYLFLYALWTDSVKYSTNLFPSLQKYFFEDALKFPKEQRLDFSQSPHLDFSKTNQQ